SGYDTGIRTKPRLAGSPPGLRLGSTALVKQALFALFNGAAGEADRVDLSDQRQAEFRHAWAAWAQANEKAIVDPGAPLNAKKLVTARGVEDFTDALTAYTIVEAASHDEAVQIFSGHPHLGLLAGNSIAVLECPSPPS
ncbi:hypothetical protein, partial [Micromonospora sp. NPDC049171]